MTVEDDATQATDPSAVADGPVRGRTDDAQGSLASPAGGLGSSWDEGPYSDGDGSFGPVTLRWDRARVWLERKPEDTPDAQASTAPSTAPSPIATIHREALARGWFVPGFTERALGLALAGGERPVVTTASFLPWLVIEARDRRRFSLVVTDRDEAYRALDALGLGPAQRPLTLAVRVAPEGSPRWLETAAHARRAGLGSLTGLVALDAALVAADLALGALALSALFALTAGALSRAWSSQRARLELSPDGRLVIARPDAAPIALDPRKIESVRLTRAGCVLDYEDAPRPITVQLLSQEQAARAVEGAGLPLGRLRALHALVDRALRLRESR